MGDAGTASDAGTDGGVAPPPDAGADAGAPDSGGAGDAGLDGGGPDAGPRSLPTFVGIGERCKLISNRNLDDPTPNQTHARFNLRGTDLGVPVVHGTDLYFFFGDTAGAQVIWPLGPESLPDAVGYSGVPYPSVAQNPDLLCSNLKFLVTGGKSGTAQADWAGGHMTPPAGVPIAQFIQNPAGVRGANAFPNLPGDFEVPSGAFSHDGSMFVFYTIINHNPFEMRGSYLARWGAPSTTGQPNYQVLHHVDQRFNANGPMRGDFINIAAVVHEGFLYAYGTGEYRKSPVHLARKPLSAVATAGGFERYDAAARTWVAANTAGTTPIVTYPNIGELSVRYFPRVDRWVMIDQELTEIAVRFAEKPEGPWSAPKSIASMVDPVFRSTYCCVNNDCSGLRLMNCDRAGFYAPYLLPDELVHGDGSWSVTFLMSTWDPYNVALMRATFRG